MTTTIICTKVSGSSLPFQISKLIGIESIKMYQDHKTKVRIKGHGYEGVINCSYLPSSLNDLSGIGFRSEIEYDIPPEWGGGSRKSHVLFLITRGVLETDLSQEFAIQVLDPDMN